MTHAEKLYQVAKALSKATGLPIDETSFPMPKPANPPLGQRPVQNEAKQ